MLLGERDGAAHRDVRRRAVGPGRSALGQAVPAADELGGVVEAQLVVLVGQLVLELLGRPYSSSTARTSTL